MLFRNLFRVLKSGGSRRPIQPSLRRRPAPCRLSVEALDERIAPAALSVSDVTLIEGDAGSQYAVVRVSLDAPTNKTVTVNYGTAAGTAAAGSDYDAVSGTLTFARGETGKSILVPVRGDPLAEGNEHFFVNLSGARGAQIADGQGMLTIIDDELPHIEIRGAAIYEGNSGTTLMTFTVSLSAASDQAVTVNYATADDTAIAGEDYRAAAGTLTFAPGETTKTVTVEVLGDVTTEHDERFVINLASASSNAIITGGQAYGGILNDDGSGDSDYLDYGYYYYGNGSDPWY